MTFIEVSNSEGHTFFINSDKIAAIEKIKGGNCLIYIGSDKPIQTNTTYEVLKARILQIEKNEKK